MCKNRIASRIIILSFIICGSFAISKAQSGKIKLTEFHKRYYGKWPKTMTYLEQLIGNRFKETWDVTNYYAASYPDKFRVDLGNIDDGNAEIRIGGDVHTFTGFKKKNKFIDLKIDFMNYIIGHMYFEELHTVADRFADAGIDLTKSFTRTWKGRKVIALGAASADTTYNQIWYDAIDMYPVRRLEMVGRNRDDYHYTIEKSEGFWFPKEFKHYRNGRLIYDRRYTQVKRNVTLDPEIFNLDNFGAVNSFNP